MSDWQRSLFETSDEIGQNQSLAERMRPRSWDELYKPKEWQKLVPLLAHNPLGHWIFYGPPGSGKTSLARLISSDPLFNPKGQRVFLELLATEVTAPTLRELSHKAAQVRSRGSYLIVFIDEIHRLNVSAQDILLPYMEKNLFSLIGATTEAPKGRLTPALLSRGRILRFVKPEGEEWASWAKLFWERRMGQDLFDIIDKELWERLVQRSAGDARQLWNLIDSCIRLQVSEAQGGPLGVQDSRVQSLLSSMESVASDSPSALVSALIKSVRAGRVQAALAYLAMMLERGVDPLYIARRLIILASEDVGLADPQALVIAQAAYSAVEKIGLPEGRIILSQVTIYLAQAKKSNASYRAIDRAIEWVKAHPEAKVPFHLRPGSVDYIYPHDKPKQAATQSYAPLVAGSHQELELPDFYRSSAEPGCD